MSLANKLKVWSALSPSLSFLSFINKDVFSFFLLSFLPCFLPFLLAFSVFLLRII